ncbi:putative thioesterase superfamily protein [Candidatus Nitrosocosmicus arcticus]|uniref:Putative thioesterase superfamily protein n=1 Tax=Candidatus Nitrosocosmicus arcticus TaxID=2035267 RepID=A0A557SXP2_9ARCH|nr:putative thioesterase superfamily protein [Candidatus Nitrosocosmicus arcticus]
MDFDIKLGTKNERRIKVSHNQTTSFLWEGENVFSTPSMISEMEETCRLLLKEQFLKVDSEWDSVGTVVNINHTAATPVGAEILLKAEVVGVDGRRVQFKVSTEDNLEQIGDGNHERFIINIPKFKEKFDLKVKKLDEYQKG